MPELDEKGVVEACPNCGKRNRVAYVQLGKIARCGNCRTDLQPLAKPIDIINAPLFDAVLQNAALPVLIDFWAAWCGPCKMMAPELNRFAERNAGKIIVAKVDTEAAPAVAARYAVRALPTLALFVGGIETARTEGARSAAQIQSFVGQSVATA